MRNFLIIFLLLICGCKTKYYVPVERKTMDSVDKITFDITQFDENGLIGQPGSKRSLAYEFCIPNIPDCKTQVKSIDQSINFSTSQDRVSCTNQQILCIGDSHQPEFLEILKKIAQLEYIEKINQRFTE